MTALDTLELELNETATRLWSALNILKMVPEASRDEDWHKRWNHFNGQIQAIQAVRQRISIMLEVQDQETLEAEEFNSKAGQAPVGWEMVEGDEPVANNDFVLIEGDETPAFTSA